MKQVQKPKKPIIFYYVVALIVILLLNLLLFPRLLEPKVTEVDYGKFLQMVDNNEISEVQIQSNEIIFSDKSSPANYYKTGVMNDYKDVYKRQSLVFKWSKHSNIGSHRISIPAPPP